MAIVHVLLFSMMQQYVKCVDMLSCLFFSNSFLVFSCQGGVQRVHIVDGTVGGSLLLELFTRDGVGTMIARYNRTVFHVSCQ